MKKSPAKENTRKTSEALRMKPDPPSSVLDSLPQDLFVKIVTHLVSSSPEPLSGLDNLRITCKRFHAASKAKPVGRCMRVDWNLHWWNKQRFFAVLRHLADAGNPEAFFILGVDQVYNNIGSRKTGLMYLEKAKSGGHDAAAYLAGNLLVGDPATRELGMGYLNGIPSTSSHVGRYQSEVASVMTRICWGRKRPPSGTAQRPSCSNAKCGDVEAADWSCRSFCSQTCRWMAECVQLHA